MSDILTALNNVSKAPECLIAFDRDGTLVPYAETPEKALATPKVKRLLTDLAALDGVQVALISARSVAQLQGDTKSAPIILAGNYGLEILFPSGKRIIEPRAAAAVPALKQLRDALFSSLVMCRGIILEDHGYSLCLHWHLVSLADRELLHEQVKTVSSDFSAVEVVERPTSYEFLPAFKWSKSDALDLINSNLEVVPVEYFYAGDTEADISAFEWVNQHKGITIRVGEDDNLCAQFRVPTPDALYDVVEYVIRRRVNS